MTRVRVEAKAGSPTYIGSYPPTYGAFRFGVRRRPARDEYHVADLTWWANGMGFLAFVTIVGSGIYWNVWPEEIRQTVVEIGRWFGILGL